MVNFRDSLQTEKAPLVQTNGEAVAQACLLFLAEVKSNYVCKYTY